ncbi:MAG: alanine racemase [Clostridia bacterium]|nr:alanine racemase [Clostridia bacterium]
MQENIAVISLKNIKNNIAAFRSLLAPTAKLYAVVKANAYGHGAERVAESVQSVVDGFVVTSVQEGVSLRFGGVSPEKEILILTPPLGEDDVFLSSLHGLSLTVCSFSSLRTVQKAVQRFGLGVTLHVKVNTGMNRLGLYGAPFIRLCSALKKAQAEGVRIQGLYSHLYSPEQKDAAENQRINFLKSREIAQSKLGPLFCHLSATGGTLLGESYHFNGVRLGIGMYGYLPHGFEIFEQNLALRPTMKLYTHALQTHRFTGGGVGYAKSKKEYGNLTAYRLGYADGFLRTGGGGRLNAIGNLCMDGCITEGKCAYGKKKPVFFSVSALANRAQTIPYEALCAATKRARFEYVEEC